MIGIGILGAALLLLLLELGNLYMRNAYLEEELAETRRHSGCRAEPVTKPYWDRIMEMTLITQTKQERKDGRSKA